eukprot:266315_1
MHELDQRVSYRVMKAVDNLHLSTVSLSKAMEEELSKKMMKREIHYIRNLIYRAIRNTKEAPPAPTLLNQQHDVPRNQDTTALNGDMLVDIYNTHRIHKFSNFQFQTYSQNQFMKTLKTNKFLKQKKDQIANMFNGSCLNRAQFVLYPSWLIADDQFIIFNYFFSASYIVNQLRLKPTRDTMRFSIYIIPKNIVSIYDENISFASTLVSDVAAFLKHNGFRPFLRAEIDESVCDDPRTLCQIITHYLNTPRTTYLSRDILLIIDRRDSRNILYVLNADVHDHKLIELQQNHLLAMEFDILASNHDNAVVKCYFRKGIGERARFYTEHLTFLMCRLFKRGIDQFEYVQNVYAHSYRHGFGTDLNDPCFNKYHKLVLNASHISVSYNRNYVPSDLADDMDQKHSSSELDIEWSRQCNAQQVKEPFECPYIDFIMRELRKFADIKQLNQLNSGQFDELLLCLALDHLTHIHSFCFQRSQRVPIKQFIQNSNGPCENEKQCDVLRQFSTRKRETQGRRNRVEMQLDNKSIEINMLMDTLSTLHCYLQHKVFDLYRDDVGGSSNKFGTIVQHAEEPLDDHDDRDEHDDHDEFDTLYTALLHLNALKFNDTSDFISRVHVWCTENGFDFDALSYDVDRKRIKSNFYQFLSSFEQEMYFDCIYRVAFNINYKAMSQDNRNELDQLKAFLINNRNISLKLVCQLDRNKGNTIIDRSRCD